MLSGIWQARERQHLVETVPDGERPPGWCRHPETQVDLQAAGQVGDQLSAGKRNPPNPDISGYIYSIYEKQYPQLEEIIQTFCELYILEGLDPRWIKDTPTLCLLFESGLPLAWVWRGRRLCSRRWTGTMTATSRRRSGWPPASRTRTCAPSSPPTPARRTGARYPISSSLFLLFLLHT